MTDVTPETVPCPYCRATIDAQAKKCIYCGEFTDQEKPGFWSFRDKRAWDFLGLLIVPFTLALLGFLLADMQDRRQEAIEAERAMTNATVEAHRANSNTLQAYLDDMSATLIHEDLERDVIRQTIRARTFATMAELDWERNNTLITFLREAMLLDWVLVWATIGSADLRGANLFEANLFGADLHGADLSRANLLKVDLNSSNLGGADLSHANLHEANLFRAYLGDANLTGADLRGANLTGADLTGARLSEASYNDDTSWPVNVDLEGAGAIERQ